MAREGTLIVGDNVLLRDRVADSTITAPSPTAMREFNGRIATDERLFGVILPLYDGISIARVTRP
jgi:caffeoyl-CoA O-methyltransferase